MYNAYCAIILNTNPMCHLLAAPHPVCLLAAHQLWNHLAGPYLLFPLLDLSISSVSQPSTLVPAPTHPLAPRHSDSHEAVSATAKVAKVLKCVAPSLTFMSRDWLLVFHASRLLHCVELLH